MKFLATLSILALTVSYSFAANSIIPCYSAKTMLNQAFECIKAKQTGNGITLYVHVLRHPNATLKMVLEASKELKSHHCKKEAILGFRRALYFREISETQALNIAENLIELGAHTLAKLILRHILDHTPKLNNATHKYIAQMYATMARKDE